MALRWNWNDQIGELTVKQFINGKLGDEEYTKSLYDGNAFLIILNEWKEPTTNENMWSMYSFFADEEHAKNCLGLNKGHSNIFLEGTTRITKIRLNKARARDWKKIVNLFARAFDEITIELYTEEDKEGGVIM